MLIVMWVGVGIFIIGLFVAAIKLCPKEKPWYKPYTGKFNDEFKQK